METKKYEVKVNNAEGTCKSALFEKMAKNGDLTSNKVKDLVSAVITIIGYAECTITTNEKTFNMNYYDTEEYGLLSSGSEIFLKSVKLYYGEVSNVRISEIKTKQGKTFKGIPVLGSDEEKVEDKKIDMANDNDKLPF